MAPEARDHKREETRRRVFEAALTIFRRDGVASCRIDDIARLAGVSRGTFYFHFPTKDDVLIARMRETEDDITAAITALPLSAPLISVLSAVSSALVRTWLPDPSLLPDVAAAALRLTASAPLDQELVPLRGALASRFRAAAERGELMPMVPPEILSDIYLGNALGGMLAWFGNRSIRLEDVLESVALLFLRGAGRL
jgi:AcrR family transcriptional regulator